MISVPFQGKSFNITVIQVYAPTNNAEEAEDEQIMVDSSDKTWSTGERNAKLFQYSCLENPMNSMKRQTGH